MGRPLVLTHLSIIILLLKSGAVDFLGKRYYAIVQWKI